jgi:phage gpG-like protein
MAHSLAEFAGHLAHAAIELEIVKHELLDEAGHIVETEAKRVLGTYEYGWPQLADSTQTERERLGFTPNDPLLRTGDLKESIEHTVHGLSSVDIGSNNLYAKFQELGTDRIPPRSFLAGAAAHEGAKIAETVGRCYQAVLEGGIATDIIKAGSRRPW